MDWSLVLVALALLGVAAVSGRLSGSPVTPAMLFVALGLLLGPKLLDGIDLPSAGSTVRALAEATLALVLFCDASRIDLGRLRRELGVPARLLGIGLPLTIAAGTGAAAALFGLLTAGEAVVLGVALAPTDAALGQAVVTEPRVPLRIRQGLNVESGLNDGICVPLLFAAVALADVESDIAHGHGAVRLLVEEIALGRDPEEVNRLSEEVGDVLSGVTFVLFGALLLGRMLGSLSWQLAAYAVLSLTLVRMLPVAVAMWGSRARRPTVAFLGWFGPRGLASIVFAVIIIERSRLPQETLIVQAIYLTVGLSVLAHGVTAAPLARRYGRWYRNHPREQPPPMESGAAGITRARGALGSPP